MTDAAWRWGRGGLRRWLQQRLPASEWSREFLHELDEELSRRAARGAGPTLTLWYLRQVLSPHTVGFARAGRARRDREHRRAGLASVVRGSLEDFRHAARSLFADRGVATLIALTLAVGIGSVAAMVGLAQRLFLEGPPHVEAPEALVRVVLEFDDPGGRRVSPWMPFLTAGAIRESVGALAGTSLYRRTDELAGIGGAVRPVVAATVDEAYFSLLGLQPAAGRLFREIDDAAAVLSRSLALQAFGTADAALGQPLRLGDSSYVVVGVVPSGFAGPDLDRIDVWVPLQSDWAGNTNWWLVGRLAPGASRLAAVAQAQAVHEAVDPGRFFGWAREGRIAMSSLREDPTGARTVENSIARLLLAVVGLVLFVSWANALSLMYARVTRRRGELLLRRALGIGRGRLVRLMVAEGLVVSLLAGVFSLPVAYAQGALVRNVLIPDVAWESGPVNGDLLGVIAAVIAATAVLLGLMAARDASRADLREGLADTSPVGPGRRVRMQALLVTGQIALSAAMLLCAGLFVKSFWTMRGTALGIDAGEVHVVNLRFLDFRLGRGGDDEDALNTRALAALRDTDTDRRVALSIGLPFRMNFGQSIHVDGREEIPELPGGGPFISVVSDGYFETVGTRIVRGVPISTGDVATGARVTVIGESTAAALWAGEDALGRCVRVGAADSSCYRVVGVAEDVHRQGYREPPSMQLYLPLGATDSFKGATLLVRATRPGGASASGLAAEIRRAVPEVDYVEARRLDSFLDPEIRPWKLGATMLSLAAALAVVMSLAGVFGVLSYLVAQRRREIGVRMALGASAGGIRRLVVRRGLAAAIAGVTLGFGLVVVARRWLSGLLFETAVTDPLVLTLAGTCLMIAAAAACLLPANQAARVDPATTLRADT